MVAAAAVAVAAVTATEQSCQLMIEEPTVMRKRIELQIKRRSNLKREIEQTVSNRREQRKENGRWIEKKTWPSKRKKHIEEIGLTER